ncbi:hypothetical protein MWN34_05995 [Ancylobacter sp. 6x-1]|uniref:Uncharacterized protein n=1 Tax=Ancylobacter crimeensis TaxID=2579147 RepID=A0ABT0D943_9HYPH|nr:hypothetical protein [Ancylobacter crimeensis]MCK0196463.1 hypothetical protein [Ancylobacter crimeensis]
MVSHEIETATPSAAQFPPRVRSEGVVRERAGLRAGVVVWLAAGLAFVLVAAAIGLWARHGEAVFFDLLAAGMAACF